MSEKWLSGAVVVLRIVQVLLVALLGALGERASDGALTEALGLPAAVQPAAGAEIPFGSSLNMQPLPLSLVLPSRLSA